MEIIVKGDRSNTDENKHAWAGFYQDGEARWLKIGVGEAGNDNEGFIASYEALKIFVGSDWTPTTPVMTLSTADDVGIGITPTHRLHVVDNVGADVAAYFFNDGNNANRYGIGIQCGMDNPFLTEHWSYPIRIFDGDASIRGYARFNNATIAWSAISDVSLKQNIVDNKTMKGMDIVRALRIRDFEWKKNPGNIVTGFVAQEIEEVYPEAVSECEGLKAYSMTDFIMPMIKGMQEVDMRISVNELEIIDLKSEIVKHEQRIAELEGL